MTGRATTWTGPVGPREQPDEPAQTVQAARRKATQFGEAAEHVPTIALSQVGRTYSGTPPVPALSDVNLTLQRGDYAAIVGPSGSGKSTLLNVLGLLDRPSEGTYLLDGIDVGVLSEDSRTSLRGQRIGFVFQAFHLLEHRSARENVELAMLYNGPFVTATTTDRSDQAGRTLVSVGLGHRLEALPSTMSGGERQRVAIARAIVNRPSLMLCDEPTGNLDTRTADSVMKVLESLNDQGQTIVIITHDPSVSSRARTRHRIVDGHLSTDPS